MFTQRVLKNKVNFQNFQISKPSLRKHENLKKKNHITAEFLDTLHSHGLQTVLVNTMTKIYLLLIFLFYHFIYFIVNDSSILIPKLLAKPSR